MVESFQEFIEEHGQVDYKKANRYAEIGREIIKCAMNSGDGESFEAAVDTIIRKNKEDFKVPKYNVSNIASCLLYDQAKTNFDLGQGFGKGSNINQYGNKEQSERTIKNLMAYFNQKRVDQESAYERLSTHDKWRDQEQLDKVEPNFNLKLGIDIESNPKTGSIPAPLKGIHTAHFVTGVDKSGVPKLLIKPENWGLKNLLHKLLHLLDFIITRFKSQKIKGLEGRQESKWVKEQMVKTTSKELFSKVKERIKELKDPGLKEKFENIADQLKNLSKTKGFEKAIKTLKEIQTELGDNQETKPLITAMETATGNLIEKAYGKYGSEYQKHSEVRVNYEQNGDTIEAVCDRMKFEDFKKRFDLTVHHPDAREEKKEEEGEGEGRSAHL